VVIEVSKGVGAVAAFRPLWGLRAMDASVAEPSAAERIARRPIGGLADDIRSARFGDGGLLDLGYAAQRPVSARNTTGLYAPNVGFA
jgi:hypothetical protein